MVKQWYNLNVQYVVVKNQEAKGLSSNLGLRTPFSKVPIFKWKFVECNSIEVQLCWMQFHWSATSLNAIYWVKFLLSGDKFMPEMHLKQPGFTYSACGPFTKNKEIIQKFTDTGDTNYIYKNEFDKACFYHDMAHGDFKDLARRTAFDKVLRDKAFNIAKNPKYDGYQRGLACIVYKCLDKKSTGSGVNMHANKERLLDLAEEYGKYGLIQRVNFTIVLLKNGKKIRILKCIRYIMKENLLWKDLLEL